MIHWVFFYLNIFVIFAFPQPTSHLSKTDKDFIQNFYQKNTGFLSSVNNLEFSSLEAYILETYCCILKTNRFFNLGYLYDDLFEYTELLNTINNQCCGNNIFSHSILLRYCTNLKNRKKTVSNGGWSLKNRKRYFKEIVQKQKKHFYKMLSQNKELTVICLQLENIEPIALYNKKQCQINGKTYDGMILEERSAIFFGVVNTSIVNSIKDQWLEWQVNNSSICADSLSLKDVNMFADFFGSIVKKNQSLLPVELIFDLCITQLKKFLKYFEITLLSITKHMKIEDRIEILRDKMGLPSSIYEPLLVQSIFLSDAIIDKK